MADELISIIIGNMITQQQLHKSQTDHLQELPDEEELQLPAPDPTEAKYTALITLAVILIVIALALLVLFIASALEQPPQVHFDYHDQAYLPSSSTHMGSASMGQASSKPSIQALAREVMREESSPSNLAEVEASNIVHRSYQHTMREIELESARLALTKYSSKQISEDSALTYASYLRALDCLQLTTFPINDYSSARLMIANADRDHFTKQYELTQMMREESSICAVVALTREGLQSGTYYYALKSLFQQDYRHLRVVVINNPEMHMLEDIAKMLNEFPSINITLIDRITTHQSLPTSFYIQASLHKYCQGTNMTILLRDNGELIGTQVLRVIDKVYHTYKPPIIFTNYILESANPIRETSEFKYKVQLYAANLANSREEAYKTKYLKIYSTQVLLKVDESAYKVGGEWSDGLLEASLQFAMLELGCGKYYFLQEIMYKATRHDIQSALQVMDARTHAKHECLHQGFNNYPEANPVEVPSTSNRQQKQSVQLIGIDDIRNLTDDQIMMLRAAFREVHATRAAQYLKIIHSHGRSVNMSAIHQQSITPASSITTKQLTDAAQKLHYGVRPYFYIAEIKRKEYSPDSIPTNIEKKTTISKQTKPSQTPTSEQELNKNETTKFCVILVTSNDYKDLAFLYTLESIITQRYGNFRVIILDNKSSDLTAEAIKYHLSLISPSERKRVTFHQAKQNMHRSELLYYAIKHLSVADEVLIMMKSGEQLLDKDVFSDFSTRYKNTRALAVYSSAIYLYNGIVIVAPAAPPSIEAIRSKTIRTIPLYLHKLISFHSALSSQINEADFKDNEGNWIEKGEDEVLGYALEELCCESVAYLNELLVRLPQKPTVAPNGNAEGSKSKYECFVPLL